MTATPTPLRELADRLRYMAAKCDSTTGVQAEKLGVTYATILPGLSGWVADDLNAAADALSARDEAVAVDWTRPIETVKGESARLAFPLDPAGADVLVHVEIGCGRWAYNLDGTPIQSNGYMPRIRNVATPPASGEAGAGSAYDGLCPCCGEIECEEAATPPAASGDARDSFNSTAAWCSAFDNDAEGWGAHYLAGRLRLATNIIRRLAAVAPAGMVLVPREIVANYRESTLIPRHRRICDEALAAPTPPATAGKEES